MTPDREEVIALRRTVVGFVAVVLPFVLTVAGCVAPSSLSGRAAAEEPVEVAVQTGTLVLCADCQVALKDETYTIKVYEGQEAKVPLIRNWELCLNCEIARFGDWSSYGATQAEGEWVRAILAHSYAQAKGTNGPFYTEHMYLADAHLQEYLTPDFPTDHPHFDLRWQGHIERLSRMMGRDVTVRVTIYQNGQVVVEAIGGTQIGEQEGDLQTGEIRIRRLR